MSEASLERITTCYSVVARQLLDERTEHGWWEGELSASALSTATAVMALSLADRVNDTPQHSALISRGLNWLASHQNEDGGWGDTILSFSNISTSMLVNAVFHAAATTTRFDDVISSSQAYIESQGGVDAVIKRYGKDHTFSVPILTHCALAGTVDWKRVMPLPFELACVPAKFYAAVRMPVVSYALPALIAIGQVIFKQCGHWNPIVRAIRRASIRPTLRLLTSIQPDHGGFLEATPLTSFVGMSLLGAGHKEHVVTQKCLSFIKASVRADGSWPIDTNLATWLTTLSVNGLTDTNAARTTDDSVRLNTAQKDRIRAWLLGQQYRVVHPYTNSPPGGWSWTDLPGGVPDADDTPGAMLAVLNLRSTDEAFEDSEIEALKNAATWLLNLQNNDGGWPTFCKGWGTLPFDRSSNDLTAHVLRALNEWRKRISDIPVGLTERTKAAMDRGCRYLQKTQATDGSWLPLWFGNQSNTDDENPLYGTAKVVLACKELNWIDRPFAKKAVDWLMQNQNDDGGWSARKGLPGSTEETAIAVEALAGVPTTKPQVLKGAAWLCDDVERGSVTEPSPIGFYFAKLWYFERLYPIIFATAALRRCIQAMKTDR